MVHRTAHLYDGSSIPTADSTKTCEKYSISAMPECSPTCKNWYYCVYVVDDHKRTHVDGWNMSNYNTSIWLVIRWIQKQCVSPRLMRWSRNADIAAMSPVCSPGSWSGNRWLLLIKGMNHRNNTNLAKGRVYGDGIFIFWGWRSIRSAIRKANKSVY